MIRPQPICLHVHPVHAVFLLLIWLLYIRLISFSYPHDFSYSYIYCVLNVYYIRSSYSIAFYTYPTHAPTPSSPLSDYNAMPNCSPTPTAELFLLSDVKMLIIMVHTVFLLLLLLPFLSFGLWHYACVVLLFFVIIIALMIWFSNVKIILLIYYYYKSP